MLARARRNFKSGDMVTRSEASPWIFPQSLSGSTGNAPLWLCLRARGAAECFINGPLCYIARHFFARQCASVAAQSACPCRALLR